MSAKVCISATGNSINSQIDARFGRCAYFIVVDRGTLEYQCLPNTAAESPHGAGIQAAQLVARQNVQAVITGMVGPNAQRVLSASGIEVVTGATGTVKDAIQKYKTGELRAGQSPADGFGFGRGMTGGGRGRRATWSHPSWPTQMGTCQSSAGERKTDASATQDELAALQKRKKLLVDELTDVKSTIDGLKRRGADNPRS
jgi:predicted Fe-Mo cluster-binding NifX family protein